MLKQPFLIVDSGLLDRTVLPSVNLSWCWWAQYS